MSQRECEVLVEENKMLKKELDYVIQLAILKKENDGLKTKIEYIKENGVPKQKVCGRLCRIDCCCND
jgi:hypothetical protein